MSNDRHEAELVARLVEAAMELANHRIRLGLWKERPISEEFVPAWVLPYLDTARLCYISGGSAWFTTREPFADQWGDDWNDAPYDCNAGYPYEFREFDKERGREPWELVRIGLHTSLSTPEHRSSGNCPYSVEAINRRATPWLAADSWSSDTSGHQVWAGATLREVEALLRLRGEALAIPHERTP